MSFTDKIFGTYTKNNKSRILSYVEEANKYKKAYHDLTHSQKKIKVRLRPQNEIVTMTEEEYAFYLKTYNFKKQQICHLELYCFFNFPFYIFNACAFGC